MTFTLDIMAKAQEPISTGGIMRYFSDYKSKLVIKPGYVMLISAIIIVGVIILHAASP